MNLLAIDPGPLLSEWLIYDTDEKRVVAHGHEANLAVLYAIDRYEFAADHLAIEMVASYGMGVGVSTFETVYWIGRFCQAWAMVRPFSRVYRKRSWGGDDDKLYDGVAMHLCKNNRAKDSNIRQALIDKFPATGGGKCPQIGTKKQPGPLYGISKHAWAALSVAITWSEQCVEKAWDKE